MEGSIGHILNITPKEKRIEGLKRLTLASHISMEKYNVEAYLDWEMKVEELFAFHHISEERKVLLATLSFQGYALYWWTSLVRKKRIHGDPPIEYWNDLKSSLRKRHIPSFYERELMDKLQSLR